MKKLITCGVEKIVFDHPRTKRSGTIACWTAVLALASCTLVSHAQERNRFWYFTYNHALRFDTLGPVEIPQAPAAHNTFASVADPLGNLQLEAYPDGIYNSSFNLVQGGGGPWGNYAFNPLIVPRPGSPMVYDVFFGRTIAFQSLGARHVGVDMSLNGGQGGVIIGETIQFADSLCGRIAGTVNSNGQDYWLLFHRWNSDAFQAYPITSSGLDTVPVISHTGSVHVDPIGLSNGLHNFRGEMVFSNSGDRIALATYNQWGIEQGDTLPAITELFNFDQSTGQVSFFMSFPGLWKSEFCELSPDGTKFYVTAGDTANYYLYQYDLSSGDPSTILASRYTVYSHHNTDLMGVVSTQYAMGMLSQGPDGRIYVNHLWGMAFDFELSSINQPNKAGADCDFQLQWMQTTNDDPSGYFPNMLKRYNDSELALGMNTSPVPDEHLSLWPNPVNDEAWLKLPDGAKISLVRITDMTGRVLRELKPSSATIQAIELQGLAAGAYVLNAVDGANMIGTARFVVE